ncbi:MAG: NAD(P)/FAD-dependent oxidoreductase [Clostridia bacterium]|nr:NAD(P)/FAD-dependent oxidoreductase [Clostridia bacterium]
MYDVLIIGAGVIGGMLARELSKYELSVCILEKENDVACGASKANSGIVHGGYDPEPGTLKAQLNTAGIQKLYDTARELNVPIKNNGSMVCAFSEAENGFLEELLNRGNQNGISGLSIISGDEARELEPELSKEVTKALLVPNAGIVCPYELTIAAIGNAMDNAVDLSLNFEVTEIVRDEECFVVSGADMRKFEGKFLINCAGAYSDKIAKLAGDGTFEIIPRCGEYILLDKEEGGLVGHTVFQVPTKEGKGILVTPTVDGNLLTGPTAVAVDTPESTNTTVSGLNKVIELAQKSVPAVDFRQTITSFCGVRASEKNGDFIIEGSKKVEGLINVAAIDSPGLTSAVAIAEYTVEILKSLGIKLELKKNWNGKRTDPHFFRNMNNEEKNEFIKKNPEYGKIVCRCEGVSEGEIRRVIRQNPPAFDVDGVKRRTRSGMGRCQGGFCMPTVIKILAQEHNISMTEVTKRGSGSVLLKGKL